MRFFRTFISLLSVGQRRQFGLLVFLMVFGTALEVVSTALVVPVLGAFAGTAGQGGSELGAGVSGRLADMLGLVGSHGTVSRGIAVLMTAFTVKSLFALWLAWRESEFAFGLQRDLSARLFAGYLSKPFLFHLNRNSAELVRNVTVEVNQFTFNATLPAVALLSEGMVAFALIALLFWMEPIGAGIALCVLGGGVAATQLLTRRRLMIWGTARQRSEGLRLQHLQQGLGAVKEVQLMGRQAQFIAKFEGENSVASDTAQRHLFVKAMPRLVLEWLCIVALAMTLLVLSLSGGNPASVVPTVGLFAAVAFRILPSVNRIVGSFQSLRFCRPVVELLEKELRGMDAPVTPPANHDAALSVTALQPPSIQIDSVGFSYGADVAPALVDVSLAIPPGSCIGIVGESGGGKSTLVDVLLGLLEPASGAVLVAGIDIRGNLHSWQSCIGYVPQSIFLTDDSLRRNVAFGLSDSEIDDELVLGALHAAKLGDFVLGLPKGLDTVVGERGARLSGGQRQRIGIARALYRSPSVLVLDEATSALDSATEAGVMDAIHQIAHGRTVIIVTHRFATLSRCDRVYSVEGGVLRPFASPVPSEKINGV